jgi:hypothetical protein
MMEPTPGYSHEEEVCQAQESWSPLVNIDIAGELYDILYLGKL